jgi:hypothetical protein
MVVSVRRAQFNLKYDLSKVRYVERVLADRAAKRITLGSSPCDLSNAPSTVDVVVFERGELLKQREGYILDLVKMVENGKFREFFTISDYASVFAKRQALSLQIEHDVDSGERNQGYGVIAVGGSEVACVVLAQPVERTDGLKELLRRNRDVIAPQLTSDLIDTDTDLAFRGLQRGQCGYVVGDAKT